MTSSDSIIGDDIPLLSREKQKLKRDDFLLSLDSLKMAKMEFEKRFIAEKLRENNGNISKTAELIGLERSNLHRKIKNYHLE
jgi:two-component system nitrogen regulation response regulator NtrX